MRSKKALQSRCKWALRKEGPLGRFWPALLAVSWFLTGTAAAKDQVNVTDLAGRQVSVSVPVDTMVLGEGRFLPSIAILDRDDPTKRIAGMMGEFKKYDPAGYAQYRRHFPHIDKIPLIGSSGAASFSVEKAFTVKPDVAVFGLSSGHGPSDRNKAILDQFHAAGIPVVIIDFRIDPLVNTPKSLRLLAKLMGRQAEAEQFIAFYDRQLGLVKNRLEDVTDRPTVFMESRVGLKPHCCEAIGQAMMGRFIDWAGGRNAFADLIPGTHGTVNVEHLLVNQPDFYIGTAIGSSATAKRFPRFIALGASTDADTARASFRRTTARIGLAQLEAIRSGRAYAIWHHFYNSPMNVAAVQAIAKWLHPKKFKDIDPRQTIETYFERFQPFPIDGVYWTGLDDMRE